MEEIPDLFSGEAAVRRPKGLEYAIGNGVSDAGTEEGGGGVGTVVPQGEGSMQVRQLDDGAAVESSVKALRRSTCAWARPVAVPWRPAR